MNSLERIRALRAQLIDGGDYVIIRRGLTQLKISGPDAAEITSAVYSRARGTFTRQELLDSFLPRHRAAAEDLLDNLLERRLLVTVSSPVAECRESPLDIFYWQFGRDRREQIDACRLVIIGVNAVTVQCAKTARLSGFHDTKLFDDPLLRDQSPDVNQDQQGSVDGIAVAGCIEPATTEVLDADCVIAASSFGGQNHLREWNRFCVAREIPFVPALLHDCVGEIGPMVVPHQTACLECLRGRQNSHIANLYESRQADIAAYHGRDIVAHHPAMPSILGNLLALEVTKFAGLKLLGQVNRYIELNLLRSEMKIHRVLKLPYCDVCGVSHSYPPIELLKPVLKPRDDTERDDV